MTPNTLRRAAKHIDDYEDCARLYNGDEMFDLYQLADAWEADRKRMETAERDRFEQSIRIEALEEIAAHYRDHIDEDCDRSGCLCDLRDKRCSAWIGAALAKEKP